MSGEGMEDRRAAKLQASMEYLMTYGLAIVIIAVVIVILFRLGIFGGAAGYGTSCVPSSGYFCQGLQLGTNGNLSFTFGQSTGTVIYNIGMACAATSTSDGLLPSPTGSLVYLSSAGAATTAPANAPGTGALSMVTAQTVSVSGLKCFDSSSNAMVALSISQNYGGFLWINYTLKSSAPGGTNPMITAKFATMVAKVV